MIHAQILRTIEGMEYSRQLPTFFLSEDILGILDEDEARFYAETFLKSINPQAEYSISVRKL